MDLKNWALVGGGIYLMIMGIALIWLMVDKQRQQRKTTHVWYTGIPFTKKEEEEYGNTTEDSHRLRSSRRGDRPEVWVPAAGRRARQDDEGAEAARRARAMRVVREGFSEVHGRRSAR